ncbi:hypothetical protein Lqui_0592 [Legionella quinlivanii]|uniref:Uncharacterized protein n=1 Tax=Legionella quinlivanii TaxID=45073 RepID=A0A0W0Y553_9GAMM|nr:hypothetical protein [Legionella quinlivanii]KTD51748.1 hypothetical protein Lqui_0592 [Legionella quinlivanii]MCW8451085.1 hypothetical protein [Legionella quinlivanii]SEF65093.1 hypothetical protein SAMN02746093_00732 [Legionella quinlivanii DSM 21216]STY10724.1 Uncharacterised protein [Legionella quinlivanii]
MGKFLRKLNERLQIVDRAGYRREQYQSYMTGPEWRNVEMASEYGEYLGQNNSMFHFPYFRQIGGLWRVFYNSYQAARQYNSRWEIISSEYMVMDVFVSAFTTMELLPKAILSLITFPFFNKENPSEMQQHLAEFYKQYAKDLQTIPFYDHEYKKIRNDLAEKYKACQNWTWGDWFSWKVVSTELLARRLISSPLSWWFHQDNNLVPATTDLLVKLNVADETDFEAAKSQLKHKIESLSKEHAIAIVDDHVYAKGKIKEKHGQSYTSVYARISAPRYAAFQPAVHAMAQNGIHTRLLAGQEQVQVKCLIEGEDSAKLNVRQKAANQVKHVNPLYTYENHIDSTRKFCLFDVPARDLHKTLTRLSSQEGVETKFIHNF